MTDQAVVAELRQVSLSEKQLNRRAVELIHAAEERRLYLKQGFPSMFEWLVQEFGYSEGAANRRLQAARLIAAAPEMAVKIETGDVNLTNLAKAQSMVRAQEKATGKLSAAKKAEVIRAVENKTSTGAEQALLTLLPDAAKNVNQDRRTIVDGETSRIASNYSHDTIELIERVKQLLSHKYPDTKMDEIVAHLARYFLDREDPVRHRSASKTKNEVTAAAAKQCVEKTRSKPVSKPVVRVTLKKHPDGCCYVDPDTGRRCGSHYQLQINHIKPRAHGGSNDPSNLNVLCRKHNLLMAEIQLGEEYANRWRSVGRNHQS